MRFVFPVMVLIVLGLPTVYMAWRLSASLEGRRRLLPQDHVEEGARIPPQERFDWSAGLDDVVGRRRHPRDVRGRRPQSDESTVGDHRGAGYPRNEP